MSRRIIVLVLLGMLGSFSALATEPPRPGAAISKVYLDMLRQQTATNPLQHGLLPLVRATVANRAAVERLGSANFFGATALPEADANVGPTAISGSRAVPVLLAKYSDTVADPLSAPALSQELFSSEWPTGCNATKTCTGTMRQYYQEVSYNTFTVTGTVFPWKAVAQKGAHYEGTDFDQGGKTYHCKGNCATAKIVELVRDALDLHPEIDWGQFDNDGPDGIPNSGDDDGFVDFVAVVQPKSGGECSDNTTGIWSQRSSFSTRGLAAYETKSRTKAGAPIKIDDFVIVPSLACDEKTMIQIGVFAHEFGHTFGLPDLYDVNDDWAGLGWWCLMAAGSWGGDGNSPERPTHMSPWAKQFLGWLTLLDVHQDAAVSIDDVETHPFAYRIPISKQQYYIMSNHSRKGFDGKLETDGLAVWKVNDSVVKAGLTDNTVNATITNPGIQLLEADGQNRLSNRDFRGGPGDLFPGTSAARKLDSTTIPATLGKVALCDISDAAARMQVRVVVSSRTCSGRLTTLLAPATVAGIDTSSLQQAVSTVPLGDTIALTGTIKNTGKNWFNSADRHLVFEDSTGSTIDVAIASAIEFPPSPNASPHQELPALMGRKIRIIGIVQQAPGAVPKLLVQAAVPLSDNQ